MRHSAGSVQPFSLARYLREEHLTNPTNELPPDLAAIDALLRNVSPEPRRSLGPEIVGRFARGERAMPIRTPTWTGLSHLALPAAAAAVVVLIQVASLAQGRSISTVSPRMVAPVRHAASRVSSTPFFHEDAFDWFDHDDDHGRSPHGLLRKRQHDDDHDSDDD